MLSPPLWREQDTRGGSHLSHHGSWYASEHTEEELLQLKNCTTANPKPQETWGADHSWQASRRTEYLFTGFLVSEPWQTRCIFTLLLCSGLLCLSSVFFFFFNQKASLYLLAFSKLHLPGMMRKCVRHGITRSKLGAGFIHSLERSVLARGHSANSVHTHLLTELTSNRLLSKRTPQSPLQRWQLQEGLVAGCPGTSLLPFITLSLSPGFQVGTSTSLVLVLAWMSPPPRRCCR